MRNKDPYGVVGEFWGKNGFYFLFYFFVVLKAHFLKIKF